jgi:hypothetical protein
MDFWKFAQNVGFCFIRGLGQFKVLQSIKFVLTIVYSYFPPNFKFKIIIVGKIRLFVASVK